MNILIRLFLPLALVGVAYAQPTIAVGGVTNAASYTNPELPGGAIARGGFFVVKGTSLGPAGIQVATPFPFPLAVGGTSIRVTVGGTTVDALMYYSSATQAAAILPSRTPAGEGTLVVVYNGQTSSPAPIRVVDSGFGIFTLNQGGTGPGVFQNANSGTDQPVNTATQSARHGQVAIIWGTGLGPVQGNEATEPPRTGDLPTNVEVYVGGKRADVTYKGRSGCCAGLDQIVFTVPQGAEGCSVPVVVRAGNVISNVVTMSIAARGGVCSDPDGLSTAALEAAQRNGSLRVGGVALSRSVSQLGVPGQATETKLDFGAGSFTRFNYEEMIRAQGSWRSSLAPAVFGSCFVSTYNPDSQNPGAPPPVPTAVVLDAGPTINVNGPRGSKQLIKQFGQYFLIFSGAGNPGPDYLEPGTYTIDNGSGGSGPDSIGPFRTTLQVPQLVSWTNINSITEVNRGNDLTVTWSGGDPNGDILISGYSVAQRAGVSFFCSERASAGRFTIPAYVLSALPPSTGRTAATLSVTGVSQAVAFTADRLDFGGISASSGTSKSVTYR